jgi:hypothetical protein
MTGSPGRPAAAGQTSPATPALLPSGYLLAASGEGAPSFWLLVEPADFVRGRRQLLGIRQRVDAMGQQPPDRIKARRDPSHLASAVGDQHTSPQCAENLSGVGVGRTRCWMRLRWSAEGRLPDLRPAEQRLAFVGVDRVRRCRVDGS